MRERSCAPRGPEPRYVREEAELGSRPLSLVCLCSGFHVSLLPRSLPTPWLPFENLIARDPLHRRQIPSRHMAAHPSGSNQQPREARVNKVFPSTPKVSYAIPAALSGTLGVPRFTHEMRSFLIAQLEKDLLITTD